MRGFSAAAQSRAPVKQVAQLWQRDRAAGCISFGQNCRLERGDNIFGTL